MFVCRSIVKPVRRSRCRRRRRPPAAAVQQHPASSRDLLFPSTVIGAAAVPARSATTASRQAPGGEVDRRPLCHVEGLLEQPANGAPPDVPVSALFLDLRVRVDEQTSPPHGAGVHPDEDGRPDPPPLERDDGGEADGTWADRSTWHASGPEGAAESGSQ